MYMCVYKPTNEKTVFYLFLLNSRARAASVCVWGEGVGGVHACVRACVRALSNLTSMNIHEHD